MSRLLLCLVLSACATRVELRDGSFVHGRVDRVSETHVEVSSNDLLIGDDVVEPVMVELEDVAGVRTRGHRLLYGSAAMAGGALGSVGLLLGTSFAPLCDDFEDDAACEATLGIAIAGIFVFTLHALALLIRGERLRRSILRELRGSSLSMQGWTLRF